MAGRPPKYKEGRMVACDFRVPESVLERIRDLAKAQDKEVPDVIRAMIEACLKKHRRVLAAEPVSR